MVSSFLDLALIPVGAVKLWFRLEESDSGDWGLTISNCADFSPVVYATYPNIRHIGWREGRYGSCYTYIKDATPNQLDELRDLLDLLSKVLLVRRSAVLKDHFTDELMYCAALDFNFSDGKSKKYTPIGKLEYQAKYEKDKGAEKRLTKELADIVLAHPLLRMCDFVAAMPSSGDTSHADIATSAAAAVASALGKPITLIEKEQTPPLKGMKVADKIAALSKALSFDEEVAGADVLIVDDLFQSGASLWSAARAARQAGAEVAYGLVCVKSWRDTDNT